MLTISRTHTPSDSLFANLKPSAKSMHVDFTPKRGPFALRSLASSSSMDSDPFSDVLPWEALFESDIWAPPSPSESQPIPSDITRTNSREDDFSSVAELDMADVSRLLDPTSIEFGFQHSYLGGLDDKTLYSPRDAFAAVCWDSAIINAQEQDQVSLPLSGELTSILEFDDEPESPTFHDQVHPIHVPISSSLLWSDDSDSDSDECRTYNDDYTPIATFHDNGTVTGAFSSIEKEKGLLYRDLTASFGMFEPVFPLSEQMESIGQSPIPITPAYNKSVSKRIAAFYSARFPSRLTASIVRQ